MSTHLLRTLLLIVMLVLCCCAAFAQTTAFTYQGKLTDNNGNPLTNNFDFEFKLFDTQPLDTGTQLGMVPLSDVQVINGIFTVEIDFPRCDVCFNGAPRWLEIHVRATSTGGDFKRLSPRQSITSTPYAVRSSAAGSADFLACQNCVTSNQISTVNGSSVVGPIAVENVPAGSDFYIHKRTTEQPAANFNIGGDGRVGNHLHVGGRFFLDAGTSVGGRLTALETGNIGIGTSDPASKLHVFGNPILRVSADSDSNAGFGLRLNNALKWSVATVSPGNFQIFNDAIGQNAVWIDRLNNNVGIGTTSPQQRLHVHGNEILSTGSQSGFKFRSRDSTSSAEDWVWYATGTGINEQANLFKAGKGDLFTIFPNGTLRIPLLAGNFSQAPLCVNITGNIIHCQSSLRYKTNIATFHAGLDLVKSLRPVTFDWKEYKAVDLGLIAEEVAAIEPLLVTRNKQGEVEGVKYDQVAVVLINAVKEQQAQIEQQRNQIESLRAVNASLNSRLRVIEKRFRRNVASARQR